MTIGAESPTPTSRVQGSKTANTTRIRKVTHTALSSPRGGQGGIRKQGHVHLKIPAAGCLRRENEYSRGPWREPGKVSARLGFFLLATFAGFAIGIKGGGCQFRMRALMICDGYKISELRR